MKKRVTVLLCSVLAVLFAAGLTAVVWESRTVSGSKQSEGGLTVWFLDVGEGSAAVLECDGHVMMVDGGPATESDKIYSFLKEHRFRNIDCLVASHPDADHIGGLSGALNYSSVSMALCTTDSHDTRTFLSFKKYLERQHVSITVPEPGCSFMLGSAEVTVLGPEKGVRYTDNTSLVLRVVYGKTSFLLMGDSERADEQHLIDIGCSLKSTLLVVGHHGSRSSTWKNFTKAVSPKYAVISVGENTFGHPADVVLKNLNEAGAEIYRTDEQGTIQCVSDGKKMSFTTEKSPGSRPVSENSGIFEGFTKIFW